METTGISELDDVFGGFYEGSVVLISGPPGSGKTSFALRLALGVSPSLFITLEENKRNMMTYFGGEPWNLAEKVERGDLVLVDYPAHEANQFFEQHGALRELVGAVKAQRICVDSLAPIAAMFKPTERFHGLLKFLETLRAFGITAVVTSVGYSHPYPKTPFGFEQLSDVWFHLEGESLQILKFKGRKISRDTFGISMENGFELV